VKPESFDLLERGFELRSIMIVVGQNQDVAVPPPGELGWQDEEVRANRIQGGVEILFGEAEPFEPMHQIVSEEQDLKERHIGHPVVGGDFPQGIVVEQFANVFLDRGMLSVESPHSPRMASEIGHQNVVGIFAILEECQLPGFDRILGDGGWGDGPPQSGGGASSSGVDNETLPPPTPSPTSRNDNGERFF